MQGSPRIDELRQKFHENPRRYFAPLANEYRKAGDPEQAIAICRAHLAQQPQHMSGHVVYGQALYDAKRADEARTVFEKALSLDPDNTIVLRQLGDIAREKGEVAEARHWYGKAVDLDPQDSEAAAYLAELAEPLLGLEETGEAGVEETGEAAKTSEETAETNLVEADSLSRGSGAGPPEKATQADDFGTLDILGTVEADAEEGVAEATPPEEQGDGVEADLKAESTFVMSGEPADSTAEGEPVPEPEESQATDDGMPEPEPTSEPEAPPEVQPAPELQPTSEQAPAPEPATEPEVAAGAEPAAEPDTALEAEEEEAVAATPDVPWRKTPQAVESPFVTRTMAELYVKQGYTEAALDVYRQLAIQHPDDAAIRERIEELSPSAPVPAQESIYMPDTDFSEKREAQQRGAEIFGDAEKREARVPDAQQRDDAEGRHFSEMSLEEPLTGEVVGDAEGEDWGGFGETLEAEIRTEGVLGDLGEAGDEEAFGERVAELDWTDPGFGFGAEEPESPEAEPVAELEEREDETQSADEATEVEGGARFVEMPVALGEFQTNIDEAGMASTSPHEAEIAPVVDGAPRMHATSDASVEADFRGDEAAAAMAAGEAIQSEPALDAPEPEPPVEAAVLSEDYPAEDVPAEDVPADRVVLEPVTPPEPPEQEIEEGGVVAYSPEPPEEGSEEAGVVAYSPEPPRDEDLPHFTPKVPTVREFFATLGARKPPGEETSGAFTARAAVPDVAGQPQHPPADELPLATDAFTSLFPGEEIAEEDTRAAFALSGALSGTSHNPVPDTIQTPPQQQEPETTQSQTQESEEDIRRFREWLDGLADS